MKYHLLLPKPGSLSPIREIFKKLSTLYQMAPTLFSVSAFTPETHTKQHTESTPSQISHHYLGG